MNQLHDVTERHRFDVARLSDYLADKLPGWSGPLDVKQFLQLLTELLRGKEE